MPVIFPSRSREVKRVNFLHNFCLHFYIFSACGTTPMSLQAESMMKAARKCGFNCTKSDRHFEVSGYPRLSHFTDFKRTLYWQQDSVQAIRTNW